MTRLQLALAIINGVKAKCAGPVGFDIRNTPFRHLCRDDADGKRFVALSSSLKDSTSFWFDARTLRRMPKAFLQNWFDHLQTGGFISSDDARLVKSFSSNPHQVSKKPGGLTVL